MPPARSRRREAPIPRRRGPSIDFSGYRVRGRERLKRRRWLQANLVFALAFVYLLLTALAADAVVIPRRHRPDAILPRADSPGLYWLILASFFFLALRCTFQVLSLWCELRAREEGGAEAD